MEIKNPFALPSIEKIRDAQLSDAHRQLMRHEALVEEHQAGVDLYKARIARLSGSVVHLHHPVAKGNPR